MAAFWGIPPTRFATWVRAQHGTGMATSIPEEVRLERMLVQRVSSFPPYAGMPRVLAGCLLQPEVPKEVSSLSTNVISSISDTDCVELGRKSTETSV